MTKCMLVVAALLLTVLAYEAVAAEEKKRPSKKVAKVIATLEMLGIKDKRIRELVETVDNRIEGKYVRIMSEEYADHRVTLRYRMGTRIGTRQFEFLYKPADDSHWSVSARTDAVMLNYRLGLR